MNEDTKILALKGKEILSYIKDLARLRIELFKSYPYLYEGNLSYEEDYLKKYVDCPESIMVVVLSNNEVVGASTAIPLEFEVPEIKKPFQDQGIDIRQVFYLGESLLKPEFRGQNIYGQFFKYREAAAKEYRCRIAAFCAVSRPNDPRKPANYLPYDEIWQYFGYSQHPELCAYLEWTDVGEDKPSTKPLIFWLKEL